MQVHPAHLNFFMTTRLVAADGHLVQVEVGHNDAVEGHRESHQASWQFKAYKGLQHLIVRPDDAADGVVKDVVVGDDEGDNDVDSDG